MRVTFYKKPDGRKIELEITKVYPEDQEWFESNKVKISMEEIGNMFAVYADCGFVDEHGEPDEVIVLSTSKSCEDTLSELRSECEKVMILKGVL